MSARLYFSNSLAALADRLIENLGTEEGDPFRAPAVATPASSLRDWLKIHLAEKWGIAANIAFPHLENLLWERLAERDRLRDVPDRQPARLLDTFSFQGLVLAQLRRNPPAELREYLRAEDATDAARRLCQISGRLASLFREYEYSRVSENGYPGIADSWSRGKACFEPALLRGTRPHPAAAHLQEVHGLETWQMEVYRGIFQEGEGLRDQWGQASGVYRYTLPQYAEKALADPVAPPAGDAAVFHLFGLSNISPFHRNLIGRLADEEKLGEGAARFEIYALNPCAEYWEDALTLRERRRFAPGPISRARVLAARPDDIEIRNAEIAEAPGENGLLTLLGKPGRETIKLWCQLTEYDFHEDFHEPARDDLLATVQKSVLSRAPALPPEERVAQDASLRIRSAPDARAEIEIVRAEAAELLRKDPSLRPEDLGLIAADPDAVLPMLRAVFAGGKDAPGNVPALLPGASSESPVLRGFRDLLGPGIASADRNALLALLENPAMLRKTRLEAARASSLRNFLEAAGFQEGWGDADEGMTDGGATAREAETRVVMALALDPADPALEGAGWWPARDAVGALERGDLAALLEWLDLLRAALRPFRQNANLSFAEWSLHLRALQDGLLAADPNEPADVRAEIDLRRFCAELGQWGEWNGKDDRVDAALIRMLFEDRFREPDPGRSGFLRGGMRVGSLPALRGIPFRHVWVTGLAADTFPASGDAAPLDLRAYRRLPGESDPAARDLYALLEVMASASESLTLSWPRRDPARDAERPSSRALNGLAAWLEADILPPGTAFDMHPAAAPARGRAPSAPFDPRNRAIGWIPEPRRGASFVEWKDLARYLRNPADQAVTQHFQLRAYDALDPDEEARAAALFVDRWKDSELLDEALRAELAEPGSGEQAFDRLWRALMQGGRLPSLPFRDIEENRLRALVTGPVAEGAALLREHTRAIGLRFAGTLRSGPQGAATAKPPVLNIPAFDLSALELPASIGGLLPWFFLGEARNGGWGALVEKDKEFSAYLLQLCIEAFSEDEAPLLLSGPAHLFTRDKEWRIRTYALPALGAARARALLRDLLEDFLGGPDFDDLGFEAIEKSARRAGNARAVGDWRAEIEALRREEDENPFARPSFSARVLRALRTGVPEDAARKIARRLEPYLAWKAAYTGSGEEEAA
jgi:exonuclease V gamma subunit